MQIPFQDKNNFEWILTYSYSAFLMHSGNHDPSMEVSTIKMAGSNGQQLQRSISSSQISHSSQSYHNTNKSQTTSMINTSPTSQETNSANIRHSPDHSTGNPPWRSGDDQTRKN